MAKKKVAPGFWWNASTKVGYVDFRVGGRSGFRVRHKIEGLNYQDALKEFGRIKESAREKAIAPSSIPVFHEYWAQYPRLRPLKPATKRSYTYMLEARIFPALGGRRLDCITPSIVLDFRSKLVAGGVTPATANRHVTLIRMLLNEAWQRSVIPTNPIPAASVKPLKEAPPVVAYLSAEERDAFLGAFDDEAGFRADVEARREMGPIVSSRAAVIPRRCGGGLRGDSEATGRAFERFRSAGPCFLCAIDAGLSRLDLIKLQWGSVDLDAGLIRFIREKTLVQVSIPITNRLKRVLHEPGPGKPEEPVFTTADGNPWSEMTLRRYFRVAKRIAGIDRPFRFHDLRHDFASSLAKRGASLLEISVLLGHTSTRMTARYAHLHPDNLRSAIDALDR